jgi:hypothetical protein
MHAKPVAQCTPTTLLPANRVKLINRGKQQPHAVLRLPLQAAQTKNRDKTRAKMLQTRPLKQECEYIHPEIEPPDKDAQQTITAGVHLPRAVHCRTILPEPHEATFQCNLPSNAAQYSQIPPLSLFCAGVLRYSQCSQGSQSINNIGPVCCSRCCCGKQAHI